MVVTALHLSCVLVWWTMENRLRPIPKIVPSLPLHVWLIPISEQLSLVQSTQRTPPKFSDQVRHVSNGTPQVVDPQFPSTNPEPASSGSTASMEPNTSQTPLNLNLSPMDLKNKSALSAAAMSPFHAPLPKTVETQIASAFSNSGPWVEERIDDDHIRMRRGNTCVTVERSLAERLDAFSDYARRIPWMVGNPYKCQ
jgi:hypothetical protein